MVKSGFPLVDSSSLSRARVDIIVSPGQRGEPLGYVAEEKQNTDVNSCSVTAAAGNDSETYLQSFLQTVHLGSQSVNNVLTVFEHEVLQLLRSLYLLNLLQR